MTKAERLTMACGASACRPANPALRRAVRLNGHHWRCRRRPEPPSPGRFGGVEIHSHDYINPFSRPICAAKSVIVVGIGNSGVDISADLGQRGLAERFTHHAARRACDAALLCSAWPADKGKTVGWLPLGGSATHPRIPRLDQCWQNGALRPAAGPTTGCWRRIPRSGIFLTRVGNGDIVPKPNIAELRGSRCALPMEAWSMPR